MIVFWGAGQFLKSIIDKPENNNVDRIVDSNPENQGENIRKYLVEGPEIVKTLSKDDVIYVTTSKKYMTEIFELVHELNPHVPVWYYTGKHFFEVVLPKLEDRKKLRKEYSNNITDEDISVWVDDILNAEALWWDNNMDEIKVYRKDRFYEREFNYPYNQIEVRAGDTVIDVGCGPLPKYGRLLKDGKIEYLPVDSLAYQYIELEIKHGYQLPVKPKFAIMEMLSAFFGENRADYIIINNAMDHCADILRAFIEAIRVLKVGGMLLLQHYEAEGMVNLYTGVHQWDFTTNDKLDLLVLRKNDEYINFTEMFDSYLEIEVKKIPVETALFVEHENYREYIIAKITKKGEIPNEIIQKYDDVQYGGKIIEALFQRLMRKD